MLAIDEVNKTLDDKNIKIFEITFMKKDGTERHMYFTINNEIIENLGVTYKATKSRVSNPDVINVVELVKDGDKWTDAQYRSFRKDSVIKIQKAVI